MRTLVATIAILTSTSTLGFAQTMPTEALAYLDADGNLQVTPDEMMGQMDKLFADMDVSGNGVLEYTEVSEFIPREVFDDADQSGDGRVSLAEYRLQVLEDFQSADRDRDGVLD